MKTYLKGIEERIGTEDSSVLIWEVEEALNEAQQENPTTFTQKARELHDLVRFCNFDAIAPWLRDEREALVRALAFARKIGDDKVAGILQDALDGNPQTDVSFSITLPGQEPHKLDIDAGEVTKFNGKDYGGTDIALSFAMDDFTDAVLRELIANSGEFELQPPLAVRQRAQADSKIGAEITGGQTATDLFRKLIAAKNPSMEAGEWDDYEKRLTERATVIPLKHVAYAPAPLKLRAQVEKKYGAVAKEILDIYALHNGAELFQHEGECGFYIAPVDQWEELHNRAVEWAEEVTWQDDKDEIPPYLYSAIAFGMIPGDSERWLFITEGEHAGKIMLSDTDLIEDEPRFESLAEFFATLLNDAARVLNSGGHVRYHFGGEELFPIRYRGDSVIVE